jgi:protein-S-isoprenylcysteine O-methyltransferase Ste14
MEAHRHSIFTALQILAAGVLFWILATRKTPWNAQRYVGTALVVMGVSFIAVARYQLGKSFAVRAKAHELVTHGLYSKIRNPIYVFGVVMFGGGNTCLAEACSLDRSGGYGHRSGDPRPP